MESLGTTLLLTAPAAVCPEPNRVDVFAFAAGTSTFPWQWKWDGAGWIGPMPLPTVAGADFAVASVGVVSLGPNRLDVFAVGKDKTPWWWRWNGLAWATPQRLVSAGANLPAVPMSAASSAPGKMDVFAAGANGNTPWWWHHDGANWLPPKGLPLPAGASIPAEKVTVVSPRTNRLDVFAPSAGSHLLHWWVEAAPGNSIWTGAWHVEDLGGNLPAEAVAVASMGPDRMDVFAASRGSNDNPLQHWWWDGTTFRGPETLGGDLVAAATSAVIPGTNQLDVYGISGDGHLVHWQWDGKDWSGPSPRGKSLAAGDVSAITSAPGRVHVFARGSDGTLQHWPGGGLANASKESWQDLSGTQSVQAPAGHCHPDSVEELAAIVKEAELQGRHVRAVGSGWSRSDVALTKDYIVETSLLGSVITGVLGASGVMNQSGSSLKLLHVEAGIKLFELNNLLDRRSLAMKTMGGSSGQSLAGAVSTSVHGHDVALAPLPDCVRAIHLVGPGGIQHWIEPSAPITNEAALSAVLGPHVKIHQNDDWFNSVLVSVGAMGIIYSMIIEVRDQYDLMESCQHLSWEEVRAQIATGALFAPPIRGVEFIVSPYKNYRGNTTHKCYLKVRTEPGAKSGPAAGSGDNLWNQITAGFALLFGNANPNQIESATTTIVDAALPATTPGHETRGFAHTVMASADPPPFPGLGLEFAFDATNNAYLGFLDEALQILETAYKDSHLAWGGWFSARFVGQSRAYLSPQNRFSRTCMVEFAAVAVLNSTRQILDLLEDAGKRHGGIQHWGMFSPPKLTAIDVAAAYPRLNTWRRIRGELTNGNALRTFDNDFTIRCGLSDPPHVDPKPDIAHWHSWQALGPEELRFSPAACSWGPNRIDVFVRETDDKLHHKWWDGNLWSGYEPLGAEQFQNSPTACSWGPDRIDVFVHGMDDRLHHKQWDGGSWSDYEPLGAEKFQYSPAACSWGPNRLDVFVRGTDDRLYHKWWDGARWSGYEQLGAEQFQDSPAACSWGSNRIDVFVRGTDARLYHKWWDGTHWSGYERLGTEQFQYAPAACSRSPDRIDVFVRGPDDRLQHKSWNGAAWSDYEQLGAELIQYGPAACSWGADRIDVFAHGTNDTLNTRSCSFG